MKAKSFKRSIAKWKDVSAAKHDVMLQEKVKQEQLTTAHTEKYFVFVLKDETATSNNSGYSKTKFTEKEATEAAMTALQTHEGNLKPCHTETHYVFEKVRE